MKWNKNYEVKNDEGNYGEKVKQETNQLKKFIDENIAVSNTTNHTNLMRTTTYIEMKYPTDVPNHNEVDDDDETME